MITPPKDAQEVAERIIDLLRDTPHNVYNSVERQNIIKELTPIIQPLITQRDQLQARCEKAERLLGGSVAVLDSTRNVHCKLLPGIHQRVDEAIETNTIFLNQPTK